MSFQSSPEKIKELLSQHDMEVSGDPVFDPKTMEWKAEVITPRNCLIQVAFRLKSTE